MTGALAVVTLALAVSLAVLGATHLSYRRRRPSRIPAPGARRILFPFVANALSQRALDASLRLALAEDATLVPVFLARVPLHLPLDAALPRQSNQAIPLQEAIEQRAAEFAIRVESRIERGRTYRHALRQTMEHERFDRVVIAAAPRGGPGFGPEDVAWILQNTQGEFVVLRPAHDETVLVPTTAQRHVIRRRLTGTPTPPKPRTTV